jgi:uncharacterized protein YceK
MKNFQQAGEESAPRKAYGGVQTDLSLATEFLVESPLKPSCGGMGKGVEVIMAAYLLAVDVPLSAVGDTLTLPWTVANELPKLQGAATLPDDCSPDTLRRHELLGPHEPQPSGY